jgi:hypothetical protein
MTQVKITIEIDNTDPHLGDRLQAIMQGIFDASGSNAEKMIVLINISLPKL